MSLWYRIKLAVVTAGKLLNITGTVPPFNTPADAIGQRWFSYLFTRPPEITPSVVATCEGQVPRVIGGDNTQIEWEFPVILWICDAAIDDAREELYQDWHETIRKRFNQQPLADLAHDCTVDVTPIFDKTLPQYEKVRMGMLLRFKAYEDR